MMERYENLGVVGEGSYGMVMKCRHKESNQIVAIKKFIESEDDKMVRKIAMREIKMLKLLRHENLVNLLEVFRRKKRLYLVFEFVDHTVLDELEKNQEGLPDAVVKRITFQVLRGLEFCHMHNVIHRDVKPENILISKSGIVKLCDFGFARTLIVGPGEVFTDYVATRWYRAPELLVGDLNYGKAVDIWAVGCLLFEMITGDPLFPGDSDIDQLFYVTKFLGNLTQRHLEIFHRNPLFNGMRLPTVRNPDLLKRHKMLTVATRELIIRALSLDASDRPTCLEMMKHSYYSEEDFATTFLEELKQQIEKETSLNPLLKSLALQKQEKNENNKDNSTRTKEKKQKGKRTSKASVNSHNDVAEQDSSASIAKQQSMASEMEYKKETKTEQQQQQRSRWNSIDSRNDSSSDAIILTGTESSRRSSMRTALDVSINIPGKNLPDIGHSINASRAHGHDVLKHHKKNHSKKVSQKPSDVVLCPVTEKAPLHIDRRKSVEELFKNDSRNDCTPNNNGDVEVSKKSSLHLPSVKGLESRQMKTSPSRGGLRKSFGTTIPHIQNIDPFPSNMNAREENIFVAEALLQRWSSKVDVKDQQSLSGNNNRPSRDGSNFPAV